LGLPSQPRGIGVDGGGLEPEGIGRYQAALHWQGRASDLGPHMAAGRLEDGRPEPVLGHLAELR